jgi:alanine racemase
MTERTSSGPPLRSAELSRDALATNLTALRDKHGDEVVIDLRSNALGCASAEVGRIANDVGIRHCLLDRAEVPPPGLEAAPQGSPAVSGWWSGPGGPVVTFSATVISLKDVPAGTPVSYGYEYRTATETTLALVSAGFADGVPRCPGAMIGIGGTCFPIAGRIAMDQCVVVIGDAPIDVGERATVWGEAPSLAQWSAWSGRPEAALLAHLGSRVVKSWR